MGTTNNDRCFDSISEAKVSVALLPMLSHFESVDDHESKTAFFRTHVPWIAELAYFHIIFKPSEGNTLREAMARLEIPLPLVNFLKKQNGAILFSGAMSIYGVHALGQLLNRDDPFARLPFNIESENYSWPPFDQKRFLAIGGYGFDGSQVCIDREDSQIYLFQREARSLARVPSYHWQNIEDWIVSEIKRLSTMFDAYGRRIVDERQTLPYVGSSA
jgi:hypothetical protein